MTRKARAPWMIAAGPLGLGVILLLAGCLAPPPTRQANTALPGSGQATVQPVSPAETWIAPGNVTPLPSMCTSVEVTAHPSDAFRLRVQVKNSAGAPAPGARVRVTFEDGNPDGPTQVWADDRGVAMLDLTPTRLALPEGSKLGVFRAYLSVYWNKPGATPEYLSTCFGQDIELAAPAEIVATVTLQP